MLCLFDDSTTSRFMQLIGQYFDYREFLNSELERRSHLNKQYSLRAFARDLGMLPQVLSLVINGKKNISSEVAIELARKLKLSSDEVSYFHDLVELSQAKSENLKEVIRYRLTKYKENQSYQILQQDIFKIISDWYHYAILELTFTEDFKYDVDWISKRLDISPSEVRKAIERLISFELLEEANGSVKKTSVNIATTQDLPSAAIRKATKQHLALSSNALEEQPVETRDFGTMTMAIDPKKIPQAKKMIRAFRRDLSEFLETGDRTEVYSFCTQLISLTKTRIRQEI